ncbi:MAG TPA: retropepsin-like aspartic protease [Planctomycetota bacterium]|nr:retropepsin-like aspartic protease [Planctomycetota bacterium]
MRGAFALALLPACAPLAAPAPAPVPRPVEEAFAAYRAGRFALAERLLAGTEATVDGPDRDLLDGLLLASRGRSAEAIAALERALRSPKLGAAAAASIHLEIARVFLDAGDLPSAARHARAAGRVPAGDLLLRFVEAFQGTPYRGIDVPSGEVPLRLEPFAEVPAGLGGGVEARLVIDTAASLCVLARSVAERAGVRPLAGREDVLDLFGGKTVASFGAVGEVSIGRVRVLDVPVLVVDDERLAFRLADFLSLVRAEGVIGLGLLRRLRTTLDFGKRTARFDPPGEGAPAGAIDARIAGGGLVVSGGANGVGGLPFLLDTGTNRSSLTALGAEALGDRVRVVAAPGGGGAVGGQVSFLRRALGVRFEFGRWVVDPLDVPVVGEGTETGVVRAGVIGLDVLRAFRVVLEPGAGWASIEKPAD